MANGKIVKYKKVFKVVIEGKTDTALPDETPMALSEAESTLRTCIGMLNYKYAWRNVTIKEVKR